MAEGQRGRRGGRAREARDVIEFLSDPQTVLPEMLDVDEAVRQIITILESQHDEAHRGATFSMYWGNQAGKGLYAAVPFGDHGDAFPAAVPAPGRLRSFIRTYLRLLTDPRTCVGIWLNQQNGLTYLEVSAVFLDRDEAIELALRYDERAIFDLQRMEEITTGGSGMPPADLPPVTERLPELRRGGRRSRRQDEGQA